MVLATETVEMPCPGGGLLEWEIPIVLKQIARNMILQCPLLVLSALFPLPPSSHGGHPSSELQVLLERKGTLQLNPCASWALCHSSLLLSFSSNRGIATLTFSWEVGLPQQVPPSLPPNLSPSCSNGILGSPIRLAGPPHPLSPMSVHPVVCFQVPFF